MLANIVVAMLALLYSSASQAQGDYPLRGSWDRPPADEVKVEGGIRFWYSSGKNHKTLFDQSGALQISKLSWTGETGKSAEAFFSITQSGVFARGYFGLGSLGGGNLQDEDFPPVIAPYSSTDSIAKDGRLRYANLDIGYYLLDTTIGKLGPFVGYHFYGEKMNANGCTQTATNPAICVPGISSAVRVITEKDDWYSFRVGVAGEFNIAPNWKISGDAAYLPYVKLKGFDTHWLRLGIDFSGPIPETAHGTGMQFEGVLTYNFNDYFNIGVGGRYWRMAAPHGQAHFDEVTLGGSAQKIKFETSRYGAFVQLGLKY